MKIGIASDHRGYNLKEQIIKCLNEKYEFVDLGTFSDESVDYPDYPELSGCYPVPSR